MGNEHMNFEEAIARLETIVRSLETGNAPLDKSLELFEEGISLVRLCNDQLVNAESKIKMLVRTPDGMTEQDFNGGQKL